MLFTMRAVDCAMKDDFNISCCVIQKISVMLVNAHLETTQCSDACVRLYGHVCLLVVVICEAVHVAESLVKSCT